MAFDERGLVVKRFNSNGDLHAKRAREVAFYRAYGSSDLLPDLIEEGDDWIALTPANGSRFADLPAADRTSHTASYAEALVRLFGQAPEPGTLARQACGAASARVTRDDAYTGISQYRTAPSPVLDALRFSLARIVLTRDLLVKLDWNSSNMFAGDGAISAFIDFEQAFVGTREMLTGAVLLNPDFDAAMLFNSLARAGLTSAGPEEIVHYMNLAFALVLLGSIGRGGVWPASRLDEAYRRHVFSRHIDVMAGQGT